VQDANGALCVHNKALFRFAQNSVLSILTYGLGQWRSKPNCGVVICEIRPQKSIVRPLGCLIIKANLWGSRSQRNC
jgi:hypothetical protein